MHGLTSGPATHHSFLRTAIMLSACILVVALVIAPFSLMQTGSNGPVGLAVAAAICLLSGLAAETVAASMGAASPLGSMLMGMFIRFFVPLGVCVAILASGQNPRSHLPFIGYLLTFYMVTLGIETWLAMKRLTAPSPDSEPTLR